MKRLLPLLILGAFVLFLLLPGSFGFTGCWKRWLIVDLPISKADAIIVLGGEPAARPAEAASLYRAGVARLVYVTGTGDAARNRQLLLSSGVPDSAVIVENRASTTYENALFLKKLLGERGVRSALLVTSPFHTRRALGTFRKVIPEIRFGVVSASIGWWGTPRGRLDLNRYALIEFLKSVEYWILYGVVPWMGSIFDPLV